jgi:nitrate reductase NapAB chaperone NapD
MSARPDIEVGELKEKWLPVVVESEDDYASKEAVKWIEALPGVYFIDTVFSSVDGDNPTAEDFNRNPKTEKIS